jgi:hypothetical protein
MTQLKLTDRTPIVEQCKTAGLSIIPDPKDKEKKIAVNIPCNRIDGEYCTTYLYPSAKWRTYPCPFSQSEVTEAQERMLNPIKASKRAAGASTGKDKK